ncbi:MAG TPA: hypothetical protein VIN04_12260 [Myxococcota bacterium]
MKSVGRRGFVGRASRVPFSGLLTLAALLAAPAGAYTIDSQSLRVGANGILDAMVCFPSNGCDVWSEFASDMDEATGLGPLLARAEAIAEIPDASGGPVRMTLTATGTSSLAPQQIQVALEYSVVIEGSPLSWDIPFVSLEHDVTFTVSAPTAYTVSSVSSPLGSWALFGPGDGEIILENEGILAPGRYRLSTYLELPPSLSADALTLTLVRLPEPGTALLLGLGIAALGRRSGRTD